LGLHVLSDFIGWIILLSRVESEVKPRALESQSHLWITVSSHRHPAVPADVRLFGRFGWNEGQHESYAYTEVDQTFQLGGDLAGYRWGRPNDKFGLVAVSNAIKRDHQEYLALGGKGFLLGDGALTYAREDILETYYTAHDWRGLFTAIDVQLIAHPGYNAARGPVAMFSVRTHVDF
jgi:high affinity Mn2+ porin